MPGLCNSRASDGTSWVQRCLTQLHHTYRLTPLTPRGSARRCPAPCRAVGDAVDASTTAIASELIARSLHGSGGDMANLLSHFNHALEGGSSRHDVEADCSFPGDMWPLPVAAPSPWLTSSSLVIATCLQQVSDARKSRNRTSLAVTISTTCPTQARARSSLPRNMQHQCLM